MCDLVSDLCGVLCMSAPASVVTPSGRTESVKVEDNRDGTVTVRYKPNEAGLHQLHVNYNNQPINGQISPANPPCTSYMYGVGSVVMRGSTFDVWLLCHAWHGCSIMPVWYGCSTMPGMVWLLNHAWYGMAASP